MASNYCSDMQKDTKILFELKYSIQNVNVILNKTSSTSLSQIYSDLCQHSLM